jgi:hypothetical protein
LCIGANTAIFTVLHAVIMAPLPFLEPGRVVGKDLRLSGVNYRSVGVMPEAFAQPGCEARLWTPLTWAPEQGTDDGRHSNNWDMVARLKPGVTIALAQQHIDALNRHNVENSGRMRKLLENARFGTTVQGLKEELVGDVRPTLYLLQCAVAFVLRIGCVNVANLMLVRSNIRMKELAIRYSLGAGRGRLAGQLLIEAMRAGFRRRSLWRADRNGRRAPAGAHQCAGIVAVGETAGRRWRRLKRHREWRAPAPAVHRRSRATARLPCSAHAGGRIAPSARRTPKRS